MLVALTLEILPALNAARDKEAAERNRKSAEDMDAQYKKLTEESQARLREIDDEAKRLGLDSEPDEPSDQDSTPDEPGEEQGDESNNKS